MKWIKEHLSTLMLILLILAFALTGFQLRKIEGAESTSIAEEISPSAVFTVGPVQVTSTVVNTWIMIVIIGGLSFWAGRTFKVHPNMAQNAIEWLRDAVDGLIAANVGSVNTAMFLPIVLGLAIFIGCSNLLGLIPGLSSPTQDINTPIAMALVVFFSVPYFGIRVSGLKGYLKHYVEPIFLMLPIEIASELARTFSLTFRLFGNIIGEEIIIAILFVIAPFIVPVPMMLFSIFTGVLQAYIFTLLTCVYIGGAVKAHQST